MRQRANRAIRHIVDTLAALALAGAWRAPDWQGPLTHEDKPTP